MIIIIQIKKLDVRRKHLKEVGTREDKSMYLRIQ
jgi:hypothetical protein